jgi:ribosomal protein S18 acetylase RimI-like enzyme
MKAKVFKGKIKIEELSKKDLKLAKEFRDYNNSLIEEEAPIRLFDRKISSKEAKEWIKRDLQKIKNKRMVVLLAKDKNKLIGLADITLYGGFQNHVGELGISVRKEYRRIGLGKYLMEEVLNLAKRKLKPKPKIIRFSVFSTNKIAQNLYKKLGFKAVAKIPKQIQYKGELIDEVVMIKEI